MFVELAPVEDNYASQIGILEKFATFLVELLVPAMSLTGLIQ